MMRELTCLWATMKVSRRKSVDRRSARPTTPVTCHDDDDHDHHDDDDHDVHHNAYNVDEDDTYSLSVDGVNSEKKCCNQGGARWHIEVTPVLIFVTLVSRILIISIIIL